MLNIGITITDLDKYESRKYECVMTYLITTLYFIPPEYIAKANFQYAYILF